MCSLFQARFCLIDAEDLHYGLPCNGPALKAFREQVRRLWFRALRRRSRHRLTWNRFAQLLTRFPLPPARITHPWQPVPARLG